MQSCNPFSSVVLFSCKIEGFRKFLLCGMATWMCILYASGCFSVPLTLSLNNRMAARWQNSRPIAIHQIWKNGNSVTVFLPNCHSAVQTQTQREPEVFQKTHGYNAQTKGIQHEVMNGEANIKLGRGHLLVMNKSSNRKNDWECSWVFHKHTTLALFASGALLREKNSSNKIFPKVSIEPPEL